MTNVMLYVMNDEVCAISTADDEIYKAKFSEVVENDSSSIILYDNMLYPQNVPEDKTEEVRNFLDSLTKQWFLKFDVYQGDE